MRQDEILLSIMLNLKERKKMTKKELFKSIWERNISKIEVDNLPYTLDGNAKNGYSVDDDYLALTSDNWVIYI